MLAFAFFVFLTLILSVFLWSIERLAADSSSSSSAAAVTASFPGNKSTRALIDCSLMPVYAVNDDQCRLLCRGTFVHSNGVCVDALLESSAAPPTAAGCNARDGFVSFLTGNTQFGSVGDTCLSVDPGVRPDDPRKPNVICRDGQLDIDYVENYPQLTACRCGPGEFLMTTLNTSVVRVHGACVPQELRPIAENSALFYSETAAGGGGKK